MGTLVPLGCRFAPNRCRISIVAATRMLLLQRARRAWTARALPFKLNFGRFASNRCRISIVTATRMLLLQPQGARETARFPPWLDARGAALPFKLNLGRFASNRCRISIVAATRMLLLQRARRVDGLALTAVNLNVAGTRHALVARFGTRVFQRFWSVATKTEDEAVHAPSRRQQEHC